MYIMQGNYSEKEVKIFSDSLCLKNLKDIFHILLYFIYLRINYLLCKHIQKTDSTVHVEPKLIQSQVIKIWLYELDRLGKLKGVLIGISNRLSFLLCQRSRHNDKVILYFSRCLISSAPLWDCCWLIKFKAMLQYY